MTDDIYQYLKWDHDHVAQLFKQFEKTKLKERQKQIVALIAQELFAHSQSEQNTFYRALEQHNEAKKEAQHGEKEHQEIVDQLDRVINSSRFGASWVKQVNKLKELVEHHVREEEHSVFDKAKDVLSSNQAYRLKEEMHFLKQQYLRGKKIEIK